MRMDPWTVPGSSSYEGDYGIRAKDDVRRSAYGKLDARDRRTFWIRAPRAVAAGAGRVETEYVYG